MLMAYVEWRMDFPQEGIRDEEIKTSLEHNKVSDPQPPPPGGFVGDHRALPSP